MSDYGVSGNYWHDKWEEVKEQNEKLRASLEYYRLNEDEENRLRRMEEAAREVDRQAGLQGSAKGMTAALRELHSALNQEVEG